MKTEYIGLEQINGPLVYIKTPQELSFNEQVELILENGEKRIGNVITLKDDIAVIQVYEGTDGMNSKGVKTVLKGKPLQVNLSKDMLGRFFDGAGKGNRLEKSLDTPSFFCNGVLPRLVCGIADHGGTPFLGRLHRSERCAPPYTGIILIYL